MARRKEIKHFRESELFTEFRRLKEEGNGKSMRKSREKRANRDYRQDRGRKMENSGKDIILEKENESL